MKVLSFISISSTETIGGKLIGSLIIKGKLNAVIEITKAWQANTSGYTTSKQAVYVENRIYRQAGDITGTGTTGNVAPTTTQPSYDENGDYNFAIEFFLVSRTIYT